MRHRTVLFEMAARLPLSDFRIHAPRSIRSARTHLIPVEWPKKKSSQASSIPRQTAVPAAMQPKPPLRPFGAEDAKLTTAQAPASCFGDELQVGTPGQPRRQCT